MTGEYDALHKRVRFEQRSAAMRKAWRTRKRIMAARKVSYETPIRETPDSTPAALTIEKDREITPVT